MHVNAGTQVSGRCARSLLIWARRYGAGREVHLVCAEHPAPQAPKGCQLVRMPECLSVIPLALPLELLALGVASVTLHTDGCSRIHELATRMDQWRQIAEVAGRSADLRVATQSAGPITRADQADAMPVLRRRSLLGLGAVPDEACAAAPDEHLDWASRLRLAVRSLAAPQGERPASPEPAAILDLVSHGCVACGVCVRACPQHALGLTTVGDRTALVFDASRCTACNRCLESCDEEALREVGRRGWDALLDEPHVIERMHTVACRRCQARFVDTAGEGLCPQCLFRQRNPFGSALPPKARRVGEIAGGLPGAGQ